MRLVWTRRNIDAPPEVVWRLLTDLTRWPQWGPSVMDAELDGPSFEQGATGTVTTFLGLRVTFEVTDFDDGEKWAWRVAGLPATHHSVERIGADRCRVGFGVPWPAAPYLAVCSIAAQRIDALALDDRPTPSMTDSNETGENETSENETSEPRETDEMTRHTT